jgi:hypothetical protein
VLAFFSHVRLLKSSNQRRSKTPSLKLDAQIAELEALDDPAIAAKSPISEELIVFATRVAIQRAMASLPPPTDEPADEKPHASDAEFRRFTEQLAQRGYDDGPKEKARPTKRPATSPGRRCCWADGRHNHG